MKRIPWLAARRWASTLSVGRHLSTLPASFDNILVETRGKVALIQLNRPKALNALNSALMYVCVCMIADAHKT